MIIEENVSLKNYTTMKIGGTARYFGKVESMEDLQTAADFIKEKKIEAMLLGGGSNVIIPDEIINRLFLKIDISGFDIVKESESFVDVSVGAGMEWDVFVKKTVELHFAGVEMLSAIPGTVGGTPVQNVGAYGGEVKDTILSVTYFDLKSEENKQEIEKKDFQNLNTISNTECKFGYRDSIFKHEGKDRFVITSVIFRLRKVVKENEKSFHVTIPQYPGVEDYFREHFGEEAIANPTLLQIREAITAIRGIKLPDPKVIMNVGSFFKNPRVEEEKLMELKKSFPDIPAFPFPDSSFEGMYKIPAGWLIEKAGLKGFDFGKMKIYEKNALVLVNKGEATYEDLNETVEKIIQTIKEKFDIVLEPEPIFVPERGLEPPHPCE